MLTKLDGTGNNDSFSPINTSAFIDGKLGDDYLLINDLSKNYLIEQLSGTVHISALSGATTPYSGNVYYASNIEHIVFSDQSFAIDANQNVYHGYIGSSYVGGVVLLAGGSGNDTFDSSASAVCDGKIGVDDFLLFDQSRHFSVKTLAGITLILPNENAAGNYKGKTYLLYNIESVKFNDGQIDLGGIPINGQATIGPYDVYLQGSATNDSFATYGGGATIDGKDGVDNLAIFDSGVNFKITSAGTGAIVTGTEKANSGYKGVSYSLSNVEYVQFSDRLYKVGTSFVASLINGTSGNDNLAGGSGVTIDGLGGIDTVTYTSNRDAMIHNSNGTWTVGSDTLTNIERLQFSDKKVALDIDGNAGKVAKILASVFGAAAVSNEEYAGIGLNLIDGGMSYEALSALAINAAGAKTREAVVDLLWTNLMGSHPSAAQAQPFVDMLAEDLSNVGTLGVIAADYAATIGVVNLTALSQTGLEYI